MGDIPESQSDRQFARQRILVPPMKLAEMYKLHSAMRHSDKQGLNDAELVAPWNGDHGCWHATGRPKPRCAGCPAQSEQAFNRRGILLRPPTTVPAEDLLEEGGACAYNAKGRKSSTDTSLGQDNYCVALLEGGWEVYAVFDGHGPEGHWPAIRAAQTLPAFLQSEDCLAMIRQKRIDAALIRAFDQVQEDLVYMSWPPNKSNPACNLPFNGCTAVCVLRHPSEQSLWVANVGDSRAVLAVPGQGAARKTTDHKPSVETERKRIEECGCEVRVQDYENLHEQRVFVQGRKYPGIMMTRSLGDLIVKDKGVIATPEVAEWPIANCEGAVVLIASDGVWEFIESSQAAEVILNCKAQGRKLRQIADKLADDAEALWEQKEPGYCDDITLLLIALDGPGLQKVRRTGKAKPETCCASGCSVQ